MGDRNATGQRPRVQQDFDTVAFYWRVAIRPYPREATALLVLIVTSAVVDMVSVGLSIPLLDVLTGQAGAAQNRVVMGMQAVLQSVGVVPSTPVVTFALLGLVSLFFVARSGLVLWNQHQIAAIAVKLRRKTRVALFEKFLHARYEEIAKRSRGTIINDITMPAEAIAGAMTNIGFFIAGAFNSLVMIGLLVYLSWWATGVIGLLAIGGIQGWRWYADQRASACGRTLYGLRGEQSKLQVDAVDGLRVVKAHGLEPRMVERQDALSAAEYAPELRLVFLRNGPILVNELIAVVIVLGLGAITFFRPSLGLRFSMLAAFLLAIRRLAPSLVGINQASVTLSRYKRELEVIEEVLERLPQEPRGGAVVDRVTDVRLAQVSFAYPSRPDHFVLSGVTAEMRRGTVNAIVGPTGAGKSTIASLLLGLYEPSSGAMFVNGVDLRRLDLAAWRKKLGYVCQDIFVFNTSIRDNIALGDERVPQSQIAWAAGVAQLHEFITSLPEGYNTVVGDRGLRLSGGQCQRLAIARAILSRPELLIFDEATSALDNLTERAVYDAISTLHDEAIVIVIAHRLSTVKEADQILVLEAGRIVERGTHEALISRRSVYARLYEEDHTHSAAGSEQAALLK